MDRLKNWKTSDNHAGLYRHKLPGKKPVTERSGQHNKNLCQNGINPFVFMDQYTFKAGEEALMMQQAMEEIDQSDLLIAAASEKAIGFGAGYAKGKGKPVIYIRH